MPNATFRFFECIAEELTLEESRVITRADLQLNEQHAPLLDDLKEELDVAGSADAMESAITALRDHFKSKGSSLPFTYDQATGRFVATDREYLSFVTEMSSIRSIGKRSADFENGVMSRLRLRVTGTLHRVGHPRSTKKRAKQFNAYLSTLGFSGNVLVGNDKDGGFDILWLLPVGTIPYRPIVSVQCKNGVYRLTEADASVASGMRSLAEHKGLQSTVHMPCVLFNDYLYPECLPKKRLGFVPLGLSDLAAMQSLISHEAI